MRFALGLLLAGCSLAPLGAQARVRVSAGATFSSKLVDDGVLSESLQSAIAPTLGAALSVPTGKGPYRIVLEADVHHGNLTVDDGTDQGTFGSLTTVDALLLFEGPVRGPIRWQVGGGTIFYEPQSRTGLFQKGGTQRWLVAGGLTWSHPLSPAMSLVAVGRVDAHEFTTSTLIAHGYGQSQRVFRAGLQLGLERSF
jgi:hypothetical protein